MTTDLDHLERLRAEATEGPWEHEGLNYFNWIVTADNQGQHELAQVEHKSDAAWITAITNAAEELLAEVRELRATVNTLQQALDATEAEAADAIAKVQRVEEALGRHPEPCTDTEWSCGWKTAVVEARAALNGGDSGPEG